MNKGEQSAEAPITHLVGIRLREPAKAEDYLIEGFAVSVGEFCLVETPRGSAVGEVRRLMRPVPEGRKGRVYPKVIRTATTSEVADWKARRGRERRGIQTCQEKARLHRLAIKIADVEIEPDGRRVTVLFNAEERVDFRELVRDLAREFHARIEMRQVGARDATRVTDGVGVCGRRLCCSGYLRKFEPISIKMGKAQEMPLTDSRLLGNCCRLKCCLLYEFSTYEGLRSRLPKVGSPCKAECSGASVEGRIKLLKVLKETVIVAFQDGTEAELPLDQITWEGRPQAKPQQ